MRIGRVVAIVAIIAFGAGGAVYLYEQEHHASREDADAAMDASADAQLAKSKKKPAKGGSGRKRTSRGRTTRVAGRRPGGGAQAAGGGALPPAVNPLGPMAPVGGGVFADNHQGATDDGVGADDNNGGAVARPRRRHGGGPTGPSYESALDKTDENLTIGGKAVPDLTDAQIAAPMSDGSFIGDCDAPDDMGVTVKVAIRNGRAVGVSVITSPSDADVAGCIDRHVRGLSWPSSPKTDSFVTTY